MPEVDKTQTYLSDPNDAWDSETTNVLKRALDEAARRALADGISADKYGVPIRDVLARKIFLWQNKASAASSA
jgi:hypothetical protein